MQSPDRELFLIDGNSLAYRAFFALPETIATSEGFPTNAIYGFTSMLIKMLSEYGQKPTVVVWDAGMSGREKVYQPYKAQRKPRPDPLREQWPAFAPIVEGFGHTNLSVDGYEADDVIASAVERARREGINTVVVTGDRDAYQLVSDDAPTIRVMATEKGISSTKTYDCAAVEDKYGVPPRLVTDFMGLRGDTSDNIPGVPGVGEKTAAQLLQEFGSLEAILDNLDKISGAKRKQNLEENADLALLSRQLATLIRDIELDLDFEQIMSGVLDPGALKELFSRYQMREPLRRLEEILGEPLARTGDGEIKRSEVESVAASSSDLATQLGDGECSVALGPDDHWAVCQENRAFFGSGVREVLESLVKHRIVAHDFKAQLKECSINTWGGSPLLVHDSAVAAYLLNPSRRDYSLSAVAQEPGLEGAPLADLAADTWRLFVEQKPALEKEGLKDLFEKIEVPLIEVLYAMEIAGVKLDTYRLGEISVRVGESVDQLEAEIYALAGGQFTIGSPQQLSQILFEKLGLTKGRRGKTGYSTDAKVLRSIRDEHEIVEKVERWRELTKLTNTYIDTLPEMISPERSRLHTTFKQTVAATGRLSSVNPNLQNIPIRTELGRQIRGCFIAEEGFKLLSADYSQVELRIMAYFSGDETLNKAYADGIDVHTLTAAEVFGSDPANVTSEERSRAKAVNFGIIYGLTAHGLADQLNVSFEEAGAYIKGYMERFPKVQEFIDKTIASATSDGYVRTLYGRRRQIPELSSSQYQTRQLGERLAVNTIIQGTAADVIKIAMVRCHKRLKEEGLSTRLVLQIHDELLFEAPESEIEKAGAIVKQEMEAASDIKPALEVELASGETWLAAKA